MGKKPDYIANAKGNPNGRQKQDKDYLKIACPIFR